MSPFLSLILPLYFETFERRKYYYDGMSDYPWLAALDANYGSMHIYQPLCKQRTICLWLIGVTFE